MTKPTLLIIHGMGSHTPESFLQQFNATMESAFKLYPSLSTKSFADFVDVKSIGYNDLFEEYRSGTGNREQFDQMLQGLPTSTLKKLFGKILNLQGGLSDDEFFNTHWLDVLSYRYGTLGTKIQLRVAMEVADAIIKEQGFAQRVHLLGHSLGTAVLHDALAKAYGEPSEDVPDPLDVVTQKLGSLHFVANTSRLLQSFQKVKDSTVKPDPNGCTARYREYRHSLDPITRVKPFNPTGNRGWIIDFAWEQKFYQLLNLTTVTNQQGNTHSIEHYLYNPKTHLQIFQDVAGIELAEAEIRQGKMTYLSQSLQGVADKAETAFRKISISDTATVFEFVKAFKTLEEFVEKFGGQFDA
jgi:hypothetical protein